MDQDLRELFVGSDDEDVVLERLRKVKKQLEEQTEDKIDISDDIDELVTELNRILLKDYTDGRKSDKNDDDWFKTTRYKYCEDYLLRFIHLYVENKSRYLLLVATSSVQGNSPILPSKSISSPLQITFWG